MRKHDLKIWPVYFEEAVAGRMPFSIRDNLGRGFQKGDLVDLWEWDPNAAPVVGIDGEDLRYTGRCIPNVEITYVESSWGVEPGKVVLGFGGARLHPWQVVTATPPKAHYGD
jgi:hypothetical protein